MQVLLTTSYDEGYLFEGADAINLLHALENGRPVKASGYGSNRTFEPREVSTPPFEVGTFKVIEDQEESALIAQLRKEAQDANTRAYKAQNELKKNKEAQDASATNIKEAKESS